MAEAEIFLTQKHIMNDGHDCQQIRKESPKTKRNAEFVIFDVFNRYEDKFKKWTTNTCASAPPTSEKYGGDCLIYEPDQTRFLCEGQAHCRRGTNRVIVAYELTADMMVHMNFEKVRVS